MSCSNEAKIALLEKNLAAQMEQINRLQQCMSYLAAGYMEMSGHCANKSSVILCGKNNERDHALNYRKCLFNELDTFKTPPSMGGYE